jgi:hypothetical protein
MVRVPCWNWRGHVLAIWRNGSIFVWAIFASWRAFAPSFALHHLPTEAKSALTKTAFALLAPGGWFLSADLILAEDDFVEELTQQMRARGIVGRAVGRDARFLDEAGTRSFLRRLEENEGDQPQRLTSDLATLEQAGFEHVAVFWRDTREVVMGGVKPRG